MAAPAKKRDIEKKSEDEDELNSSDGSSDENEVELNDEEGKKIMVDFVGRTPEDPDFHGIKILLQQLFLKAHVNVGSLAEYIISRNYVGSVVKQGLDNDEEEESDDEDDDINDVFGITTVVNISHGQLSSQSEQCVQELRTLLKNLASEFADDKTNTTIKNILENDASALGLIINERFVNIPAEISIPLLENLVADMQRATKKKMPYEFQYYVLISKLYKPKTVTGKKKSKKGSEEPESFWSNQEEEIFAEDAMCSFEFSVDKETDTGLSGTWTEDDDEMTPFRRVMLFESSKLVNMIEKVKTILTN